MADIEEDLQESDSDLSDEEVRFCGFKNLRISCNFRLSHTLHFLVSQLQRDFASGKLQVGLNRLQPQGNTRAPYNNVVSLLWRTI